MDAMIREEVAADAAEIGALTAAAFLNAPHTSHTEQHIVDALRAAGALSLSLVADLDGALIGHVAISPVSISDGTTGWFGLGRISVLPQYQRRGVGSRLMQEALRKLREQGAQGCVVLGEPRYYGRFGFQADRRLALEGVPAEYFQALAFAGSPAQGRVTYHPAFDSP